MSTAYSPLYKKAVILLRSHKFATIILLQRNFRLGYRSALHLMEELEDNGIVSRLLPNDKRFVIYRKQSHWRFK